MSITSIEKSKKKNREEKEFQSIQDRFHQAAENLKQNDTEENFRALLDSMFDQLQYLTSRPEVDDMIEREKEALKHFYERYKDIFTVIPIREIGKLQLYANAMLNLVPSMFHGDWQKNFDAYIDFGHFHLDEFDPVCGKLEDQYGKPEYPFQFKPMDTVSLEAALKDCLEKIIDLCSQSEDSNISEILYQSARLFELDELLTDLFGEEVLLYCH